MSPDSCHAHFLIDELSTCAHKLQLPRGAALQVGSVLLCYAVPRVNNYFKLNICSFHVFCLSLQNHETKDHKGTSEKTDRRTQVHLKEICLRTFSV